MYFSDEITLISETTIPGEPGNAGIAKTLKATVWANKKQAKYSEFYKAAAIGKTITAVFEVHTEDYSGEMLVEYQGKLYGVERTFQTAPDTIEISCTDARQNKTGGRIP